MPRLREFSRAETGENRDRYVLRLPDARGVENHELIISSPRDVAQEILGEAEIKITIKEDSTPEDWEREVRPLWDQQGRDLRKATELEEVRTLFKQSIPEDTRA